MTFGVAAIRTARLPSEIVIINYGSLCSIANGNEFIKDNLKSPFFSEAPFVPLDIIVFLLDRVFPLVYNPPMKSKLLSNRS